jgi:hypothetical protein
MTRKFIFTANTLLFCAIFLAACAGGQGAVKKDGGESAGDRANVGGDEMWGDIEFVSQLEGEWEGSGVINVPANESRGIPETVFYADLSLSYTGLNAVRQIRVSFYAFLTDMLSIHPGSPLTIDDLWEQLFETVYVGYTLIEEEYALVIENSISVENLFNDAENKLFINQDETRLQWFIQDGPLNELLGPFGLSGPVEFILEKR